MDKLTIRLEAIKLAATFRSQPEDVIKVAKDFEEYIIGNAEVSEYYNPNKYLYDMLEKVNIGKNVFMTNGIGEKSEDVFLQKDGEKVE